MQTPKPILEKLTKRKQENTFRFLCEESLPVDFFSNDYLGFAREEKISQKATEILSGYRLMAGATGSRLISGNHALYTDTERFIADFHNTEGALIFNSGYDANLAIFASIPQKNDVVLYDEFIHASIRDGLRLSLAKSFGFQHNSLEKLEEKLQRFSSVAQNIYVATEGIFSMDGDTPDLLSMLRICQKYNAYLIVDEAHSFGVRGKKGQGIVQELALEKEVFIRLVTFGKALGAHGAAVLASKEIVNYLINFARSFIYTTALPAYSVAHILAGYYFLPKNTQKIENLQKNISFFKENIIKNQLEAVFIPSDSAIQGAILPDIQRMQNILAQMHSKGLAVKPIFSPTVPKGQERIRICLHSFNTEQEILALLGCVLNK